MKLKLFFIAYFFPSVFLAKAQNKPLIFTSHETSASLGSVSKEDLLMTRYAPDTSADAVVLLDNGYLFLHHGSYESKCYLTCLKRIKVFKKSAFNEYGKHTITMRNSEKLLDIKAQTINPDSSITPVKEFFNEKDKYGSKKIFVFPNLQEGSIVEYEYTIESDNIFELYPWYFQSEIPVRHSELMFDIALDLQYVFFTKGNVKHDKYKFYRTVSPNNRLTIGDDAASARFYADTLEAMKPESYVTTLNDYRTSIKFQLKSMQIPFWENNTGMNPKEREFIQDWPALAKELRNDKNLGKQLTKKSQYSDIWKAVKPLLVNAKTDEEKIQIVYTYISENVSWIDDYFSIYAQESLNNAFKKKKANSGELNLMLIACLNEAGINALPLLVSTREHGQPNKEYPIVRQFNHLLCYIENKEKPLFLDAGNVFRPINVPRVPSLNGSGWVLDAKNPRWIDMPRPTSSETMVANLDLQADGTLKGTIESQHQGYSAVDERTYAHDEGKNEHVKKEWAKLFPDIQFDSIVLMNKNDVNQPFQRTMYCTIPNAATVANDFIYVKPSLTSDFNDNPFKQEKRNYPVDLPYPISDHFVLNLTIPNGYTIEELPQNKAGSLKNDGGSFAYSCTKTDNTVQVKIDIELKQRLFPVEKYAVIKMFFEQIVTKKSEQIVLKKGGVATTKQ